jgi:hypothetical protein
MRSRLTRHAMRQRSALTTAIVLAVVIAGTTLAAATGDPLRLGMTNTINAATTWSGAATSRLLQISNTSTAAGARALSVLSSAAASTLYVQNTGTGAGVQIQVAAGKPPITVNGAAGKATNLNADKLDGLDSTQLQRDGTIRLSSEVDGSTGTNNVEFDWVEWQFTQPAGRTFVGFAIEATATVPSTCTGGYPGGYLFARLDDDGAYRRFSAVRFWTAQTANTSITYILDPNSSTGTATFVAPSSDTVRTLALTVRDDCTDASDWTFTSVVVDLIFAG